MQWTLQTLFWASELIVLTLVLAPPIRFLWNGWCLRKQEFTNRLKGKNISVYLDRFWDQSLASNATISGEPNDKKFSHVYDLIVGKSLYTSPLILLACTTFIFGGLVISFALRSGYEQYIIDYISWSDTEKQLAPAGQEHLTMSSIDAMVMPFSRIDLTLSSMAAISGAYLYVVGIVIQGYRRRSLLSSDLWWCSFRLIISIPLVLVFLKLRAKLLEHSLVFP